MARHSGIRANVLLLLALACATPSWAGWPSNYNDAVQVCGASGIQSSPVICSDSTGGVFIAWQDLRAGNSDIYLSRLLANGDRAPGWTVDGNLIVGLASTQITPAIAPDGFGGAIITWQDLRSGNYDIYAQRVNSSGVVQWTANGVQLCNAAGTQQYPKIVSDFGGAFVTWEDLRGGTSDIYAQRLTSVGGLASGWGGLTARAIVATAGSQRAPRIVNDAQGGAIITFLNATNTGEARRISSGGTVFGGSWATIFMGSDWEFIPDGAGGLLFATTGSGLPNVGLQRVDGNGVQIWTDDIPTGSDWPIGVRVVSDGSNGMIVSWDESANGRMMSRIGAGGAVAPGWPLFLGRQIVGVTTGTDHVMISDDSRGAIYLHSSQIDGPHRDIWAQHVSDVATVVIGWDPPGVTGGYGGRAVALGARDQDQLVATTDGAGGAIAAWADDRLGLSSDDIYAQRIDFYGQLGNPEPLITEVQDVGRDQGGKIRIRWAASYLDSVLRLVETYSVWRQVPNTSLMAPGVELVAGTSEARERAAALAATGSKRRVLMAESNATSVIYWEFLASLEAHGTGTYSYVASTTSDSSAAGNPFTIVRVDAVNPHWEILYQSSSRVGLAWWRSSADSGYSVDNLAPFAPAPFAGSFSIGGTSLHWRPNIEPDLAGYRLYRGTPANFPTHPGTLIAEPSDTAHVDPIGAPFFYKLTAVDVHGNESPATSLQPSGTTEAGIEGNVSLALVGMTPNPILERGEVRFQLARSGPARLALLDLQGRQVRSLFDGWRSAGPHTAIWDGRDDGGRRAPPGIYMLRLVAAGRVLTKKAVVAR